MNMMQYEAISIAASYDEAQMRELIVLRGLSEVQRFNVLVSLDSSCITIKLCLRAFYLMTQYRHLRA